jgi:predicted nucleic acid-binding protein
VIVVDNSVLAETLLTGRHTDQLARRGTLHAPQVCDLELAATIGRWLRAGFLGEQRAGEVVVDYLTLRLELHSHRPLLARCIGLHATFSAYDAVYVALAERLAAPFFTLDRRLARAVRRHAPAVEVLEA